MASKSRLVEFLGTLTADENDYFERSFKALDVPEAEYAGPELTPATQAFEDLLEQAAREGGYAEMLAVLLPAEWIDLHANEGFKAFVSWLRDELDREGEVASPRRRRRIERLFRRTVSLEIAFFEMAYEPDSAIDATSEET